MLRGHVRTPPDLILRWTGIRTAGEVDVVIHHHAYSDAGRDLQIDREKEAGSGPDFADPGNLATTKRARSTVGLMPLRSFS